MRLPVSRTHHPITAAVLALALVLAGGVIGLPGSATANPTLHTSDDGQYAFYCEGGGTATLETYLGGGGEIVVPDVVTSAESGTCDVTEIGVATFRDTGLTAVTFSSKVTILGAAFTGNHLESVTLSSDGTGTTNIPVGAFADQTVDGRDVVGWVDQDGRTRSDLDGSFDFGTFTAQLAEGITHQVTFEPENGEPPTTVTVADGEPVDPPEEPSPPPLEPGAESVQLVYWIRSLAGDADPYDFGAPVTDDLTLYAVWRQVPKDVHTVTFVPNTDGSADPAFTVEVVDGDPVAEPPTPTPYDSTSTSRWEFRGWGRDSGPYDFDTPVTGDLVLTGAWTKVETQVVEYTTIATVTTVNKQVIPGTSLDVKLDLLGKIDATSPPPFDPPSFLSLTPGFGLQITGCLHPGGQPALDDLTADPDYEIDLGFNPACIGGQEPSVGIPPYTGPLPPSGSKVALCQVFCTDAARMSVESTPRFLGTMTIDELGQGASTVTIPADLEPGPHTLVFDLGQRELRYPITVVADRSLPPAGGSEASLLPAALALTVLGAVVAARTRRLV